MRLRTLITGAAILLALGACSKPQDNGGHPTSAGSEGAAAPSGYWISNADVETRLILPQAIESLPILHKQLYDEGRVELDRFALEAGHDRTELSNQGFPLPPYSKIISWQMGGRSDGLASLYARVATDEGGAHPNEEYQTVIWDKKSNRRLYPRDLFAASADMKNVNELLCRALEVEKSKRAGKPLLQKGNCPTIENGQVALIPSEVPGKIGGIAVLYAPYEVAAYAEGSYEVRISQGLIRNNLNPKFAQEFAGDPSPVLLSDQFPKPEAAGSTPPLPVSE